LENGQLYVALSRVKSPVDLYILLPDDMDDFTIRPPVDLYVVQILETMESSRALPIPQISPRDNVEPGVGSIDPFDATLAKEFPCPDDYVDASEDPTDCTPSLDHDVVEVFDLCPDEISLNVQIMSRALRTNRCFDLIVSEISYVKAIYPDLLCLLRRFSVGYFQHAAQNPCQ
jgi:hypothetical protein